ncbi:MAG: Transcription initiation factor TFIID subunit 12 [Geoglossum simile]|nr:MAG: Transcription initiation factor TFIID subunit 12 [Geoglossum simile]
MNEALPGGDTAPTLLRQAAPAIPLRKSLQSSPGMYNTSPPQNQQGAPGQQPPFLPRVEQIKSLPYLTAQQKESYEDGLKKLWDTINSNPPESAEHQTASKKLEHAGLTIKTALKRWQQANMNQGKQEGGRHTGQMQQPQPQQQQQNQGMRGPPSGQVQLTPQVAQHIAQFQFILPPNMPPDTPESQKWLSEAKLRYGQALQRQDAAKQAITSLEQRRQAAAEAKPLSQEEQMELQHKKATLVKGYTDARKFVEVFRKQQSEFRNQAQQRTQGAAATQIGQGGNPGASAGSVNRGPQQTPPATAQHPGQQPQIPPNTVPTVNAPIESVRNQPSTTVSPSSAGPQSQSGQGPQSAQGQPPQGQARTPSVGGAPGNPQQQTVTQQRDSPQSAQPTQSATQTGPPRPLSHQAAMEQAQRNYANGSASTPNANNHPHSHPTPRDITTPKMPIPKNLTTSLPTPVSMGPARPTLAGGPSGTNNVMGQPALSRHPGYALEGEGERVLSKKKLDELVRQVTGGGEGREGEGLSAEVEESILALADDFVDQVITSACRLAKLRQSSTLEIRDIQLILERNYNIRIPGYASDEIRTVRKFAPAQGWTQKMSAVQAAKVTGGKAEL